MTQEIVLVRDRILYVKGWIACVWDRATLWLAWTVFGRIQPRTNDKTGKVGHFSDIVTISGKGCQSR